MRRFLGAMMRLGDGLAPSGLYDALAKLRSVTCAFDLSKVSKKDQKVRSEKKVQTVLICSNKLNGRSRLARAGSPAGQKVDMGVMV